MCSYHSHALGRRLKARLWIPHARWQHSQIIHKFIDAADQVLSCLSFVGNFAEYLHIQQIVEHQSIINVKKLNSLKRLVRTTVAMSHN